MRALIVDGEDIRLDAHRAAPAAGRGEAVVRLAKAAISHTDLAIARGLLNFRGVLGHEFVGIVDSVQSEGGVKSGGSGLVGKRVVGAIATVCGKCDMCQGGLSAHCRQRTIMGMRGRDGCLAERFTLPVKNLVAVPDSVDDDHAVFAHLLAAAMQVAQQLTIVGKPFITVLGDGPLGLLMVQVMSKLNASVRLVGKHADKLAICEKWGIKHRLVEDIGRRADQDIVVDCTGSPSGLELAMQLVRPRGKIVLKTLVPPAKTEKGSGSVDLTPLVLNEIELIGSHCGPINEAMNAIARREVDVVSLISKRMSLSDGPALLKAASQMDVIRLLVEP
jgi:threonine dehydrogenase-like Zn-dependent dehydrogenase